MEKYYLAIDIGASSGRHIMGWQENGAVKTEEVYRFPNGMDEQDGHLVWDIKRLEREVRTGIDKALERFPGIVSLSIDTWAVDYVLLKGNQPIYPCYAYRDSRTGQAVQAVHDILPFETLYAKTGIQFQPFNTIYQLYADRLAGRLDQACGFLMIPEYLMYRLCGVKSHEYTNATTGGMVSAESGQYDDEIIRALELPRRFFKPLQQPGTVIGKYKGIKVILCATHDTASAVEGIPMEEEGLFLSSGTWSLLGAKLSAPVTTRESMEANFSNEGGVGYVRYLKNLMGMWLVNRLREELCPEAPFSEIEQIARESRYEGMADVTAQRLMAPQSMSEEIKSALLETGEAAPKSPGDFFRCAYRSLASGYGKAVRELEALTGKQYGVLYIVGGGAKNGFLNRLTEEMSGKRVVALPIEATALGNLKIQMTADQF